MKDDTDRTTKTNLSLPRFLGNEGKSEEVSSVFASILRRGYDPRNESQGTVQPEWLESIEELSKKKEIWIDNFSDLITVKLGNGHENDVFRSKDGNNVIKFNNLLYIYDKASLIQFIERINSHNEFSIESPYIMLGFTRNPEGKIGIVMSQPFIKKAFEADSFAIENYLLNHGYKYGNLLLSNKKGWTNGVYEFNDAVPRNVLMDSNGNLYFIDLQINNPKRFIQYLSDYKYYCEKKKESIEIIKNRFENPVIKSFSENDYKVLKLFIADKDTLTEKKCILTDLLKDAIPYIDKDYLIWEENIQEELNNFAEGIIQDNSQGWKR